MRRPKKQYPKGFVPVMILLTALLVLFVAWLIAEPYLPQLTLSVFGPAQTSSQSAPEPSSSSQPEKKPAALEPPPTQATMASGR